MIVKYIWVHNNKFRYNMRVIDCDINDIPVSKYEQDNKIYVLSPCYTIVDPMSSVLSYITLCDVYDSYEITSKPIASNTRYKAKETFSKYDFTRKLVANFGFTQEYCTDTSNTSLQKTIAEEHLFACIKSGIRVTELNCDNNRWSFSTALYPGILAGDHLLLARFLLETIGEKHGVVVDFQQSTYLIRYNISTMMRSNDLHRYMNDPINKHTKLYYNDNINTYNRHIRDNNYSQFSHFEVLSPCADPYSATLQTFVGYMSSVPSDALL